MCRQQLWVIFLLVSIVSSSNALFAQQSREERALYFTDETEKRFYGGIVAGVNMCQVDGDGLSGFHRVGLNIGGVVKWQIHPKVVTDVEMLFSQKGSKSVSQNANGNIGSYFEFYDIKLNYAEVPIIFNYLINKKYQVGLGASYNALIGSKETYETPYGITEFDPELFKFNSNNVDLMFQLTGVFSGWVLGFRIQYSVTPIRKAYYVPQNLGGGNQYNRIVALRLGYLF
jgi:hypothetical protein